MTRGFTALLGAALVTGICATHVEHARQPVAIAIEPASLAITVGERRRLRAVGRDSSGRTLPGEAVAWSTQNASVATVTDSGEVRGVQPGLTGIVARSGRALAVANVAVAAASVATRSVAPAAAIAAVAEPAAAAPARTAPAQTAAGARVGTAPAPEATAASSGIPAWAARAIGAAPDTVTLPPAPPGGRRNSPHFSHISIFYTDFYTNYRPPAERQQIIDFLARRIDGVMEGNGKQWKAANPTIIRFPYTLLYSIKLPGQGDPEAITVTYSSDMRDWFARHPQYRYERAFVHRGGADSTHRVVLRPSKNNWRWVINPGDPGLRAYQIDRYRQIAAGNDGAFLDEFGDDLMGAAKPSDEYPTQAAYLRAMTDLVAEIHRAIAPKFLLMNIGEYWSPADSALVVAAGGAHLERTNYPFGDKLPERWTQIDRLLAANVYTEFVALWAYTDWVKGRGAFPTLGPGMYRSLVERGQITQLASYYMVVPRDAQRLSLDQQNLWSVRPDTVWMRAVEYDIGHPTGPRRVMASGVDPVGQKYRVYARDFDRALVLIRPDGDWHKQVYGDDTGVPLTLPRPMRPLLRDGTLGAPVRTVTLRNVEGAILIK